MNVLSLFDGMACGMIALERAGICVNSYHASEIDSKAIEVSSINYPAINQLGDVTKWKDWNVNWSGIDMLIGGSPCQGFSFAGKQLAFYDPRSALFFTFVDIRNHINIKRAEAGKNPVKFMLENVKMAKSHIDVITEHLGVDPMFINSALVSAQSRQRLYWFNWDVDQPDDKRITMNDIVGDGFYSTREKSYCLDANYGKGTNFRRYFFCGSRQLVLEDGYSPNLTKDTANNVMHSDGNRWRMLTVNECEMLQTVPVGYVDSANIAPSHKYKMLGNGWTVDVVAHIFRGLKQS